MQRTARDTVDKIDGMLDCQNRMVLTTLLPKAHIDVLVLAGLSVRGDIKFRDGANGLATLDRHNASDLGSMLWSANLRSVLTADRASQLLSGYGRYASNTIARYVPPLTSPRLDPRHVLSAIETFDFFASGSADYATSTAAEYCQRLRLAMIRDLPGFIAPPHVFYSVDQAAVKTIGLEL